MEIIVKTSSRQAEFSPNMAFSTFAEIPLFGENQKCGGRFYRRWKYDLLYCAGSFRARHVQLWQIVFSKHHVPGGYETIRRGREGGGDECYTGYNR